MPRFTSEEAKAQWLEKVRRTMAARKSAHGGTVVPVSIGVVEPVGTLDQKIAQLQAELAILEQAREILAR